MQKIPETGSRLICGAFREFAGRILSDQQKRKELVSHLKTVQASIHCEFFNKPRQDKVLNAPIWSLDNYKKKKRQLEKWVIQEQKALLIQALDKSFASFKKYSPGQVRYLI